MCKTNEYELDDEAATELARALAAVKGEIGTRGNARYIRNLFESALQKQASRITGLKSPGRDDLKRIVASDVIAATSRWH